MYLFQVPIEVLKDKLKVSEGFWERFESPDYKCNGCGTGWNKHIVPNTVYGLNIRIVCCIHDDDYEIGGTEEDRKIADERIHDNIETVIDCFDKWYYPTNAAKLRANTYRAFVRELGAGSFNYNEEVL